MEVNRIGIDVDGVIRDIYTPLIQCAKNSFPSQTIMEYSKWNYKLSDNFEIKDKIYSFLSNPETAEKIFFTNATAYSGMVIFMLYMARRGKEICIITRNITTQRMILTIKFLEKIGITPNEVHFGDTDEFKRHIDCDLYIEDSPKEILYYRSNNKYVIVPERPWNKEISEDKYIKKCQHGGITMCKMVKLIEKESE